MKVSAQYAEEHFADILNAAASGEEVEIARPNRPTYRLALVPAGPRTTKDPHILGAGVGEMIVPSWEEWKAMDKQLEREINEAPLVSGAYIREEMNAYGMELLPIRYEHILQLEALAAHHSGHSTACSSPRRSPNRSPSSPTMKNSRCIPSS